MRTYTTPLFTLKTDRPFRTKETTPFIVYLINKLPYNDYNSTLTRTDFSENGERKYG